MLTNTTHNAVTVILLTPNAICDLQPTTGCLHLNVQWHNVYS